VLRDSESCDPTASANRTEPDLVSHLNGGCTHHNEIVERRADDLLTSGVTPLASNSKTSMASRSPCPTTYSVWTSSSPARTTNLTSPGGSHAVWAEPVHPGSSQPTISSKSSHELSSLRLQEEQSRPKHHKAAMLPTAQLNCSQTDHRCVGSVFRVASLGQGCRLVFVRVLAPWADYVDGRPEPPVPRYVVLGCLEEARSPLLFGQAASLPFPHSNRTTN